MGTIYFLVRVIVPRIKINKVETDLRFKEKEEIINPTFFAGISQFKTSNEYAKYLKSVGTPSSLRISSIKGKNLLLRFNKSIILDCQ